MAKGCLREATFCFYFDLCPSGLTIESCVELQAS